MWLSDPGCSRVVEAVWSSDDMVDLSTKVMRKVEKGGKELKRWNRDHFGNVRKELAKKRRLLLDVEKEAMRSGLNHRVMELKREITEFKDMENRMWFQRAKVWWAKDGDKNSKFFHSRATQRKRKNSIQKIWAVSSDWTSNLEEVEKCLINYFQELFTSANLQHNAATTGSIIKVTSNEMNAQLSTEFKAWEVQ